MTQPQVKLPALFHLVRDVDETGVSGTGTVAKGVEMANGSCLMQWTVSPAQSIVLYASMEELISIHGHNGNTRVEYLEPVDQSDLERAACVAQDAVSMMAGLTRMVLTA